MGTPFLLSRKIQHSIVEGIELLRVGSFTERDLKALLIDLREIAKYLAKVIKDINEYTEAIKEFIDVCDFIAHASRDRGVVERVVREHMKKLYAAINSGQDDCFQIPVEGVLVANKLVATLEGVSSFALDKLVHAHTKLHYRQSEIALCIMSLLQDSVVSLKDDEGFGVLHLMPYEGKYRLYCRVENSKIEREVRTHTGGDGNLVLAFPVMVSNVECLDKEVYSYNYKEPSMPIFETFRDGSSNLRVRTMQQA